MMTQPTREDVAVAEADPTIGCVTVVQLKALLAGWAERDRDDEPTGVWIETGWCLSSPVISAGPLNHRPLEEGGWTADILLESAVWQEPTDPDAFAAWWVKYGTDNPHMTTYRTHVQAAFRAGQESARVREAREKKL